MKLKPLHDRVLIRRIEGTEKTKSGIIIPDTAKEKPQSVTTKGRSTRSRSRRATACCSASTPATRSRSKARST